MSRNRIEPPIWWAEYNVFTSDIDLEVVQSLGAATIIRIVDAGAGALAVRMESHEGLTVQMTGMSLGEETIGRFTKIVAENATAEVVGTLAAVGIVDLADAMTLTMSVDGGGTETATFNTADFSDITAPTLAELKVVVEADTTATFDATGTLPTINSPTAGSAGTIQITGGTGAAALGFTDQAEFAGADTDVVKVRVGWPAQ